MASGDFSIGSEVWPGLSKVVEEMGEVAQVIGKLMGTGGLEQHWDGTNLRLRLREELADLQAALDFVQAKNFNDKDDDFIKERRAVKLAAFCDWHLRQTKPANETTSDQQTKP